MIVANSNIAESRAGDRRLIVNADDFGRAAGINRGIIAAHERGIVTSASLMVRWPDATDAATYARRRPELSFGLHLDFGEWIYHCEEWKAVYEVVPLDDIAAIAKEIDAQVDAFFELVGRIPTHLDSHQHVHRQQPIRVLARQAAARLGIPLRHLPQAPRYCGDFHGQSSRGEPLHDQIGVANLLKILGELPPGLTEIACHPGDATDDWPPYAQERRIELDTLCDEAVKSFIAMEGIVLCGFGDLTSSIGGTCLNQTSGRLT